MEKHQQIMNVLKLARRTKHDLKIVSNDGKEVLGHKVVVGLHSKYLTGVFLSVNEDDSIVCLLVPVEGEVLEDIINIIYDDTDKEISYQAVEYADSIFHIDLDDVIDGRLKNGDIRENVVDHNSSTEETNYEAPFENKELKTKDPKEHLTETYHSPSLDKEIIESEGNILKSRRENRKSKS